MEMDFTRIACGDQRLAGGVDRIPDLSALFQSLRGPLRIDGHGDYPFDLVLCQRVDAAAGRGD